MLYTHEEAKAERFNNVNVNEGNVWERRPWRSSDQIRNGTNQEKRNLEV